MKNKSAWGYHLMLDCSSCNDNIKNKKAIQIFIKDLIRTIKMVPHGKPLIEYLLPGHKNQGYSMIQLIKTSNISAHFMDLNGTAYFDIFSCKKFNPKLAEKIIKKHFGPKKYKIKFLTRQAPNI
jgi:S-adenosylmethionine/arginine decarboxylase-like enzyme